MIHFFSAYLNEGFLHLENIVGQALIEWKTGVKPNLPPVNVRVSIVSLLLVYILFVALIISFEQQLPYPTYNKDEFLVNVDFILPFLMMAAFMVSAGFLTKVKPHPLSLFLTLSLLQYLLRYFRSLFLKRNRESERR